jgi:hypothetical protein
MKAPTFQLPSNWLPTSFQLPVFQLALPIELARWKVGRTFHLAWSLHRPYWRLSGLVRGGADVRSQSALGALLGETEQAVADATAMMPAGDMAQAKRDTTPYASALAALRAKCPAYVPDDRWRQVMADATAFTSEWGERAQAFGWTEPELFGLHPIPERSAANYSRLSRLVEMGSVWLLRSRPVVILTETTVAIQGANAILTYRKINKPALGPVGDSLDDWGAT